MKKIYITIIIVIFVILISLLILYIPINKKKDGFTINMLNNNNNDIDSGLQYNITNHPGRNRILSFYSMSSSSPQPPTSEQINNMRKKIDEWFQNASSANKLKPMDKWAKISIDAALDSVEMGNWGIGNVLCYMPKGTENNPTKWVEILRGGNRFFTRNLTDILSTSNFVPRFDSHGHGEMIVLDAFEDKLCKGMYDKSNANYKFGKDSPIDFKKKNDIVGYGMPDGIVLFTQLNSCQMCLSRIGNSGISRCYWIGPDTAGGMAHRLCDSVPAYFNMLNRQLHDVADVSQEMIQFAFDVFAGPDAAWVTYCTWKLGQVGSESNLTADYKYCPGQYYANTKFGQNAVYDWSGFFRTVDMTGGPKLSCTVTPP